MRRVSGERRNGALRVVPRLTTMATVAAVVLAAAGFLLAAGACDDEGPQDRTGDAAVDGTIQNILDGDRDAFRDALAAVERPCKQPGTADIGELACPEGTSGDTAEVFQVTACHAEYRVPEQFGEVVETFLGAGSAANDWKLYAAYRGTDELLGETYRVVFADGNGAGRVAWIRSSGKVVLMELGCGETVPSALIEGVTEFVVAPAD